VALDDQLRDNDQHLRDFVAITEPAPLLHDPGSKTVSATKYLVAWSHHSLVHTEGKFAALAGVNSIPISLGNTTRHRLNRGDERTPNKALHMIAIIKLAHE
jgi:hypothetical protein